jgi:hypothetical protein
MVEGKLYVAKLRAAIKLFEKNKQAGTPWPTQSHRQESGPQHSV